MRHFVNTFCFLYDIMTFVMYKSIFGQNWSEFIMQIDDISGKSIFLLPGIPSVADLLKSKGKALVEDFLQRFYESSNNSC